MKQGASTGPGDGRDSRWDNHRAHRREELLDDVIAAVRRHGSGVGMDQIAAQAQTSKTAIYRYFTDKPDLYRQVGRKLAARLVDDIWAAVGAQSDDRTMLEAGVRAYVRLLAEDPELYRFVVHNPGPERSATGRPVDYSGTLSELICGLFVTRLEQLQAPTEPARPWGVAVVGAVRAAGDWWLDHPGLSPDELCDYLVSLLWHGMANSAAALPAGSALSAPKGPSS